MLKFVLEICVFQVNFLLEICAFQVSVNETEHDMDEESLLFHAVSHGPVFENTVMMKTNLMTKVYSGFYT